MSVASSTSKCLPRIFGFSHDPIDHNQTPTEERKQINVDLRLEADDQRFARGGMKRGLKLHYKAAPAGRRMVFLGRFVKFSGMEAVGRTTSIDLGHPNTFVDSE